MCLAISASIHARHSRRHHSLAKQLGETNARNSREAANPWAMRCCQSSPPLDALFVEEGLHFASASELAVFGQERFNEVRDPASLVVLAGVRDKEIKLIGIARHVHRTRFWTGSILRLTDCAAIMNEEPPSASTNRG